MAFSAVVLPAPLGPISPSIRPSSTRKSMPSSATVVPNDLRRPRASMHAIGSTLLLAIIRLFQWPSAPVFRGLQQLIRLQAQPLDGCRDPRPLLGQKFPALALQQQVASAALHKHSQTSPFF